VTHPARTDAQALQRANALILQWQARVRIGVALVAGGTAILLQYFDLLQGRPISLLVAMAGYVAVIGGLAVTIQHRGVAGNLEIGATVVADLLFIFVSTLASSSPEYFERILILAFFVLHMTESYFGREHASVALLVVIMGYLGMVGVGIERGAQLLWPQEFWSVTLFAIAAGVFIFQYGGFQRRLQNLVTLFHNAEEGDFNTAYDVSADLYPDAITSVGQAYNRVRTQLASMVLSDPLTACLNRRGFDQAVTREIARSARAGSELSLISIDIDHFKSVNDTYGHLAGDVILREVGALFVQTARGADMVARTGGEEFSVLLPDTNALGGYKAALRMCELVRTHRFMLNGKRVQLTVSIGVATASGTDDDPGALSLKQRADEALYAAKRGGRDRARAWNGELASVG